MDSLRDAIGLAHKKLAQITKKWGYIETDEYVLSILGALKDMYYVEIHKNLVYVGTAESEREIRKHIRDIISLVFPVFDAKFEMIEKMRKKIRTANMRECDVARKKELDSLTASYMALYDDFYAIVSFRSLEHFALYMEWDTPEKDKVWKYNLNCFHGFWYYANQMVLDKKWKTIEKQCPVGYGKSFCDIVLISFIFGNDRDADILKIVGNPNLVGDFTTKLVKYMCSPRYARVFPYYAQFKQEQNVMFDICQLGGGQQPGKLLIHGSRKGTSLLIINKDTAIDGGRFKYRFYDDITKSVDKTNIAAHEKDRRRYLDQWTKRKYDDEDNYEIFSGTTYHLEDFLSFVKRRFGGDAAKQSSVNKYTKINESMQAVFVSVPKLDQETEESTFPHKFSTAEAKRSRIEDYNTFMAMEQQEPVPLEGCPFMYSSIMTYATIPHGEDESDESCWATLDPARSGKNYVSMPIFVKVGDYHYFKDCIFDLITMDRAIPMIIDKIIKHHITKLNVEVNTDTSLPLIIQKELQRLGITWCEVMSTYSVKKKDDKIYNAETSIKANMVFPEFGIYAESSSMGKFMKYFTSYSYTSKNSFDDAPDSIAMYSDKFISGRAYVPKVEVLNIRRR